MTRDEFWRLVEGLEPEGAEEQLEQRLMSLGPESVAAFQAHFDRLHERAYDWMLWAAAYIIEGGCSDDGFIDFRYGLISRGKEFYETALSDPDSMADIIGEDDLIPNESFGYVAMEVYERKTGNEIPREDFELPSYPDPTGEEWDFDDEELCASKLPKLWARFGGQVWEG